MSTPKKPSSAPAPHDHAGQNHGHDHGHDHAGHSHAKAEPAKPEVKRRDATGHLDPAYAAKLRALSLEENPKDDNRAFLSGPRTGDELAENFGEEFVASATSGESEAERSSSEDVTPDEVGGPFVITSGGTEFAKGTDKSNPKTATREPFPKT